MIDHVALQAADVDAAVSFYDRLLAPLGSERIMDFPTPHGRTVGYGVGGKPSFWLGPAVSDGTPREVHVALAAADRVAVLAVHAAAVAAGAEVLHEPRLWPEYHPDYFAVFVRDPDGNNVEAVCHLPEFRE